MITRRALLAGAAATPILALQGRAEAATTLPMTVVNHTYRYANNAIFLYVVGTDPATGRQVYVRADGAKVPVSLSLNGPDGYADLSIPLASGGDTRVTLPWMAGRVYVSMGQKLKFRVVLDGNGQPALQHPAGWVRSDPSYNVLHDFMEFNFESTGMYCNTTMVDMFSIPMELRLVGQATQTAGTLVQNGRDQIFAGLAAEPTFRPLIVGDNLRVIAPGHGIEAGIFPGNYFDAYINQVWNAYAGSSMRVVAGGVTYTGRVLGGQFAFDKGVGSFARPSTRDVFFCNGALFAGAPPRGPVAAILGAGFNRGTLISHPDQPTTDPGTFYRPSVTNHYARVLHANTRDRKAYGYPFDDVADQSTYIQDHGPTSIRLRLTPFNANP
ncbi:Beta-1,3-glucanase [Nonomuraea solani]|uniref:Beta-1,3-glucanase n=1 Tax=Nonomuraea solani TaxID=1144553 RepID=A0A1H5VIK6_9ACTN|nr:beta-1,3-glucanase family protein [Nonomuraea solani]SEF86628.1 Beta-1,3-glucanase [Nonomuraea solani]